MSKPYILITGGAGYIGSHTCSVLSERGYEPVVLDNLSRGHKELVKFGPLVEGDIGDPALIEKICDQYRPVAALHFAALIEVAESIKMAHHYMRNNNDKARKLIETLRMNGVDKIVFSSTAAVYGTPKQASPISENAELKPINPYGESKLKAEIFLREQKDIHSVVLRYFNAAGAQPEKAIGEAHWPESHLIPNALLALLSVKPERLTIFGNDYPTSDGTAIRDYVHVLDLAEAHVLALDYLLNGGGSEVINLGTGTGYSVKQVIGEIVTVTGKQVPHDFGPRRPGDPSMLVADNKKAQDVLKWRPQRKLSDIINSAYQWHSTALYKDLIGKARPQSAILP